MDGNHCRACSEELLFNREPLVKRHDNIDLRGKLQFVTGIKIEDDDRFSKALCTRCFNDTIAAFGFKTKCLETENRLVSFEFLDILDSERLFEAVVVKTETDPAPVVLEIVLPQTSDQPRYSDEEDSSSGQVDSTMPSPLAITEEKPKSAKQKRTAAIQSKVKSNRKKPARRKYRSPSERNEELKCSLCGYLVLRKLDLVAHMRDEHSLNAFQCAFCKKSYTLQSKLLRHIQKFHPDHQLSEDELEIIAENDAKNKNLVKDKCCEFCGKYFTQSTLNAHRRNIHLKSNARLVECDLCDKKFKDTKQMRRHVISHIPYEFRSFQCDLCQKKFSCLEILRTHERYIHSTTVESHSCKFCGKTYAHRASLNTHVSAKHKNVDREFPCEQCERIFSKRSQLKHHVDVFHKVGGRKQHVCSVCGNRFDFKELLSGHMQYHTARKVACDEPGCGKTFLRERLMLRHKKSAHLKIKEHKCTRSGCDKAYASKAKMLHHIRLYHDNFKVNCPVGNGCSFAVGRRDFMRNHLKKHRELTPEDVANYAAKFIEWGLV